MLRCFPCWFQGETITRNSFISSRQLKWRCMKGVGVLWEYELLGPASFGAFDLVFVHVPVVQYAFHYPKPLSSFSNLEARTNPTGDWWRSGSQLRFGLGLSIAYRRWPPFVSSFGKSRGLRSTSGAFLFPKSMWLFNQKTSEGPLKPGARRLDPSKCFTREMSQMIPVPH